MIDKEFFLVIEEKPKNRWRKRPQTEKSLIILHLFRKPEVTFKSKKLQKNSAKTEKKTLKGALRCLKAAKQKTSGPLGKED